MSKVKRVRQGVKDRRRDVERAIGRRDLLRAQRAVLEGEITTAQERRELYRKAVVFLEAVTESARRDVVAGFEDIVTHALRAVLGDEYALTVDYSLKRNAAHADFKVSTPDDVGGDPLSSRGGGVVDLLSFALRVVVCELLGVTGPLILDEPFRNLSAGHEQRMGEVVAELSERFGRQIVMVTHKNACATLAHQVKI